MIKLIDFLEKRIGYNKFTEFFVSAIAYTYFYKNIIKKINKENNKKIILSFGMPSYLFNISEVLKNLVACGYKVYAFAEWSSYDEGYAKELKNNPIDGVTVFDAPCSSRVLPFLKTQIFLSSVAGKHYYFPKTTNKVFYFHSIAGLDGFTPGGLDSYDIFLASTTQQYNELQDRFTELNLNKTIYKTGYPKLDKLAIKAANQTSDNNKTNAKTVLYAPTYVSDSIYAEVSNFHQSELIIESILQLGYKVIFRPHPVMLKHNLGIDLINTLVKKFANQNFILDTTPDYFNTYINSDLMITDISGTSINFRLAFNKPVVFFINSLDLAKKALSSIEEIGACAFTLAELTEQVQANLHNDSYEINNQVVYNLGHSDEVMTQQIIELANLGGSNCKAS